MCSAPPPTPISTRFDQLIKKLGFHPRLGVISRTIEAAAIDLAFFFVLFLFITMLFTMLAHGLFGRQFDE